MVIDCGTNKITSTKDSNTKKIVANSMARKLGDITEEFEAQWYYTPDGKVEIPEGSVLCILVKRGDN